MTQTEVSDEMLMAFVDGELNDAEAARLEFLISADPALADRAERFLQSRLLVQEALSGTRDEVAPPHLIGAILGTGQDLQSVRRQQAGWQWAVAASIAVIAAVSGFLGSQMLSGSPPQSSLMAEATDRSVLDALAGIPAGQSVSIDLSGRGLAATVVGSYPVDQGYCRLFTLSAADEQVRALSCGSGDDWSVPVAVLESASGFQPASGAEAIDVYLDNAGAGAALDATAEQAAQEAGWAP